MKRYFITAIGTGSGKTLVSTILCEALKADYWKPVQSGTEEIDVEFVKSMISNTFTKFHPEKFKLKMPASPNIAANAEGIEINVFDFKLPTTSNKLIIEGAGGILVPLNDNGDFVIDLVTKFDCEVILVVNLYLGCINHSLLTINELRRRNISIKGIIFNGKPNKEVEYTILYYSKLPCLFRLNHQSTINKETIVEQAALFLKSNPTSHFE